jgi:hypothetical protein
MLKEEHMKFDLDWLIGTCSKCGYNGKMLEVPNLKYFYLWQCSQCYNQAAPKDFRDEAAIEAEILLGSKTVEIVKTKQYGKSFEDIYRAKISQVYYDVIQKFFRKERINWLETPLWEIRDMDLAVSRGFIWIAPHGNFETLTVEPMDGSQYEIAVRMPHPPDTNEERYFYACSGYSINELGTFSGFDTSGH